jgi:predicted RNA-binding protein with PIN domain
MTIDSLVKLSYKEMKRFRQGSMHILIDGYNLIRQSAAFRCFDRLSLEAGRKALVQSLATYKKQTGHRVTVVFDAWESGFLTEERDRHGGINILYSRRGETADDLIKRMIENRKEEFVVVTSDRAIADFASHRGVAAIASPVFESRLERAASARAGDDDGQQAVEEEGEGEKGTLSTKKKGPSRRLSKKQKQALSTIKKL